MGWSKVTLHPLQTPCISNGQASDVPREGTWPRDVEGLQCLALGGRRFLCTNKGAGRLRIRRRRRRGLAGREKQKLAASSRIEEDYSTSGEHEMLKQSTKQAFCICRWWRSRQYDVIPTPSHCHHTSHSPSCCSSHDHSGKPELPHIAALRHLDAQSTGSYRPSPGGPPDAERPAPTETRRSLPLP